MEISIKKFRCSTRLLMEHLIGTTAMDSSIECKVLQVFLQKKNYTEMDIKDLLRFLSLKLLHPAFTLPIAVAFEDLLLLILNNSLNLKNNNENEDDLLLLPERFAEYQHKCIALAKLMHLSTDAKKYAIKFFLQKPAPFQDPTQTPQVKKAKIDTSKNMPPIDRLSLLECCHQLLSADPIFFKELWNWAPLVEHCLSDSAKQTNNLQQLYSNYIIGILTNMSSTQLKKLNANIPAEVQLEYESAQQLPSICTANAMPELNDELFNATININIDSDMISNIEGVLLPIYNKSNYKFYAQTDGSYDKIVKVDSTKVNLRSIALGIAASKTICLTGSVGCGKTTLVEYLARKTGRIQPKRNELANEQQQQIGKENSKAINAKPRTSPPPGKKRKSSSYSTLQEIEAQLEQSSNDPNCNANGFLRIQLGDQTDSKMLLGQYRCTDVPGEFVWLPGVLTQAVMHGYWLLLEDLDYATQDTFTILSNLLENNSLSVPGYRDCVKIEPGFQLFVTVRTNKSSTTGNPSQKSLFSLLEKYLYTINILPLSRNELCKVISCNYPKLATVANRIVDVFLTFSSGNHAAADNLRRQETDDKADTTEKYIALPYEEITLNGMPNSGRLVSTRDLIKLCERSDPMFNVTSAECAYFVFQNAVDVFCSYLPQGKEKTKLISSIGAKLGIIQSRCEFLADEYKPDVTVDNQRIKVGRAELFSKMNTLYQSTQELLMTTTRDQSQALKRLKLTQNTERSIAPVAAKKSNATFSFTRLASCILERIAICVAHAEPVLLVGETGVGKTSAVQYLAERTQHKLVVVNMNNQSDVSDLVGGFKPVDLTYVVAPLRTEFEILFRLTFNQTKNETFLNKFAICYNQGNFAIIIKLMLKVVHSVFEKSERNELRAQEIAQLPRWQLLKVKLLKLNAQLTKSINISFAFIPGSLVNCIKNGDWVLLDEINLASAETLECLSTILEPDGSVVLLEKGDFTPVKRHANFRIFACMNPNTDIGKKDLSVGIRNRFTEFYVDELTTDADLTLLISDYLSSTGIQKKSVTNIVKLYKKLKTLSSLELNDGLGNRPVYSLRTLCRSLRVCARNLCGSIERNLYESFCMSFLTQLDPASHNIVLQLIKDALLSNAKAVLSQGIPKPGVNYLNFEGYWIEAGTKPQLSCDNYILTASVKQNLKDLSRIIAIGKLPILLQGPTSAGKTSLIEYVAKRSGNFCMRINNHEHTDLQEYIGTYAADVTGKLSFKEGVLVQAMRNGYWIILDELNLASTDILEALNRVLDDNRELFIPETQTVIKAHANFMLFATQNPPGLYGGRKTLSRAFKNRFIELHFSEIPRNELEIILEQRCLIPASYAKKMVMCMSDLQKNRKTTSKNVFTLRDLFRWGNRYTYADKQLLADNKYDWNQHLVEEGYLVLSAKVRTALEIEIIEETLYRNFKKRINHASLFDAQSSTVEISPVTKNIINSIKTFKQRADIVWTRNMTRMAVLTAKALQFNEPVLLVGPTGCGKTTICQILASIHDVTLRILNCHMHTEGADFLGGLRPCRQSEEGATSKKLFEWADGPLIFAMQEGSYFMADEISLAEDSVLERLNCVLEPERTLLLAEKGGVADDEITKEFVIQACDGFQFLATMNPGGDFGKKELSPALRNRFTEIWCLPSDSKEDLIQIASNCLATAANAVSKEETLRISQYLVEIVLHIRDHVEKFKFSVRDILAWANYIVSNDQLSFAEKAIFGLETIFLDALEMLPHESLEKIEQLKANIIDFAIRRSEQIMKIKFTTQELQQYRGTEVILDSNGQEFGIKPFFIAANPNSKVTANANFLFDAPTTKKNLFRLLSALSLKKPVLLEGPPGVGKTSIVESIASAIGYQIVRINLCEHTDLADLFGTDLPAEDKQFDEQTIEDAENPDVGTFVWRDGPLLAALKAQHTWILLDELNLAPQSVLEGLNAILDHRGEVYIPELNKTFQLSQHTRIFACQNPLRQGGGRKGLPQSFLNRFNKVYLRKLTTEDLLYVVNGKYAHFFEHLRMEFSKILRNCNSSEPDLFKLFKNQTLLVEKSNANTATPYALDLAERLVKFSELLDTGIADMEFGYKGGPYEINLRDILRWCELLLNPETSFIMQGINDEDRTQNNSAAQLFHYNFKNFLLTIYERMKLVYYQRMRSEYDKLFIRNAFAKVFDCDAEQLNAFSEEVSLYWTDEKIYLNDIVLKRDVSSECGALRPLKHNSQAPLLLSSQREFLKNIIECVHMEKPVLLCGPTDSGKTKLIDTMCTLSNQICNTDCIDDSVTGSFQQIDLNRHLEEISQSVEYLFSVYVQNAALENGSTTVVTRLLNAWSDYNKLNKIKPDLSSSTAMSEELLTFRKRINLLNIVIEHLIDVPALKTVPAAFISQLQQQQNLLVTLQKRTRNAESLNTGGSFEWVDSKIVKSLKIGQYISLEHVNLCSSAVLDRLNPIFEPNGTLLISEKGVTGNDTAEIVGKAPNFRAFLTIDPKNGELSRAMRNRCVELALVKDTYTIDDMRIIVHSQGITQIEAINCILQIHTLITQISEINYYTISHLTQFSFLTASYKRIGYTTERAIYVSGMEVYVYAANIDLIGYGLDFYQNKLREIVLKESKKLETHTAATTHVVNLQNVILNTNELNSATMIKLQLEPLKILLKSNFIPQTTLAELFKSFENYNFNNLKYEELLRYYIYMLYETSTVCDVKQRHLYLKNLLSDHPQLLELSKRLYENVQSAAQNFDPATASLPWNNKLYTRIRDYAMQVINVSHQKVYRLSALLISQLILKDIPHESVLKLQQIDALSYSQAIGANKITDKLKHTFLQHFAGFLQSLQEVIHVALGYADFSLESYTQIITAYLWYNRLLETSQQKLFMAKELNTVLIDKLLLHFKWLDKHLLKLLSHIAPNYNQMNANFDVNLQKLTNYVLSIKHPLNLIRKVYTKHLSQFQPFYKEQQVSLHTLSQKLENALSVIPLYGNLTKDMILKKFVAQKTDAAKKCRAQLQQLNYNIFDYNFKQEDVATIWGETLPENLRAAVYQFMTANKELSETQDDFDATTFEAELEHILELINTKDELPMSLRPKDIDLSMLPLREYYLNKCLAFVLTNKTPQHNEFNENYIECLPSLNIETMQLLKMLKSTKYNNFVKLWIPMEDYIKNIQNPKEFAALISYLKGNYSSVSTFERIIENVSFKQQLNNLASRDICNSILYNSDIEHLSANYVYEGPVLTRALIALIYQNDGQHKPVPLQELDLWQQSLKQMRQLLWHNANVMSKSYSTRSCNLKSTQLHASKLLREVEYVKELCENLENENFSDYNENFQKLVQTLSAAESHTALQYKHKQQEHFSLQYLSEEYAASVLNALIGAIELCLLSFTPLIDPVEKNRLKNAYIVEDINCLTTLTSVYDFMRIIMKYKYFGAEIHKALEERLVALAERQIKYAQKVALRPDKCLYNSLVQDIKHFLYTNCEPAALLHIIQIAQKSWSILSDASQYSAENLELCNEALSKIEIWLANAKNFVHHVLKRYTEYYQDFVQPLVCSVEKLRFGLEGLKITLTQQKSVIVPQSDKSDQIVNLNSDGKLHNVLADIIEFPAIRNLEIYNVHSSRDILKNRAVIFSVLNRVKGSEFDYLRLLKAKIIELRNIISISANIEDETFQEFDFAFNICNQIWQDEEEKRRKRKAEDESLYVSKTKCEAEDEELIELQEIEENFPTNVEEDFGEFMQEETLEKVMKLNDKEKINKARNTTHQVIHDEDYAFLVENFIEVMEQYSDIYYHQPGNKEQQQLELKAPFKERMRVFVKLFSHYRCGLNEWLDERAYNSFSYAISLQQKLLNELPVTAAEKSRSSSSRHVYNFYKDSNIPEIIACTEVLQSIEERVRLQLDLYPEHAGLIDIIRVIERIRQLPSTAPVVRFNTGFQLLRQKVALWNEVAHKNNHLRNEEITVAEFVQKWTRLELQFWRTCLTQTSEKVEAHAYKYWFFIYNLFQEYLQEHEIDSTLTDIRQAEKRFADGETEDVAVITERSKVEVRDVVRILRQFVESSSYGDFHVRMQLLRSFELYLHKLNVSDDDEPAEERVRILIASLRNLQIYFQQFAQDIEETKRSMRAPIEKKLKELVKIESYNKDLSYFSMRNNIARVHRNLNKFLKEYRLQLQQKITPVFQPKDATVKDLNTENDKGKDLRYESKIKCFVIDIRNFIAPQKLREKYVTELEDTAAKDLEQPKFLLQKIGKLFATSRNVVRQTVSNANFPKLIIALDELFCQHLERCDHLRNLEVDRTRERPQQKLEAKQILQQKRKGLSDLFKSLAQLGLSYKSGLMELSLATEFEDYTLQPFCIRTMLATTKDKRIYTQLTQNLDLYYAKCVFKLKLLQQLMLTPLSELGPPNIERIKGFAVDMFLLVQQQRSLLAETTKSIYDLRLLLQRLKELADITAVESVKESHLEFIKSRDIYLVLKSSLCRIRFVMEQFNLLLTCAPGERDEENCVQTVVGAEVAVLLQNSPLYAKISKQTDHIIQATKKSLSAMLHCETEFISVEKLNTYHTAHAQIVNEIKQLRECFKFAAENGDYLPIANSLTDLLAFIEYTTVTNFKPSPSMPPISYDVIDTELENVVHTVLLSLQKLYKKYPSPKPEVEESKPKVVDTYADETELSEQHLKKKLHAELTADWETLNLFSVISKISNIILAIKHAEATEEKLNYLLKLTSVLPILEQFQLIAEYYLLQQLGSHRVTAKMLSVMLTVFVEISSKGFCVPADLMQDEEGQSKKDQKEGEGFGLEDGTGEKDASDKIESEDQLEDAKRPEDRKDDNDKKQDDCKEEKGIEMSDDFEGKMQDIEKPENEEDDSGESEDEEDLNKEMGETEEGAEKLDDQIWGDDEQPEEQEEEEEKDMQEEDGKGSKDEKESHNDLDSKNDTTKDGQDEHEKDALDATQEPDQDDKQKKKENQPDIDNIKDPEVDEEQINAFHNELEEPPEPEEMDLGNMNNVDEGQEDEDQQQGDENPFDIDAMKENMQTAEDQDDKGEQNDEQNKEEEETRDDNASDTDSDEDEAGIESKEDKTTAEEEKNQDDDAKEEQELEPETQKRGELQEEDEEQQQQQTENDEEKREEKPEEHAESKDKSSKEENVQSVPETENTGSADQVQSENDDKDVKQDQKMDEQETGEEKDGVGQAENDTNEGGHQGIAETKETVSQEERKNERKTEEKRKQGRTDEERTLGEAEHNKLKQLKTIDKLKEHNENDKTEDKDVESEEYQHVKEPKNSDKTTLDNATEEQTKQLKHQEDDKNQNEEIEGETADDLMDTPEDETINQTDVENLQEMSAEQFDQKSEKPSKSEKTNERAEAQEEKMEIEGEDVQTITVPRNDDTTAHCIKEILLDNTTTAQDLSVLETLELRKMYQQQMTTNKAQTLPQHEDYETWQIISTRMVQNARELCEQLRLILEPTKCTRLKGDYRTGRRINMKKIIPYIASQFRKDKIWLRRTKPAQRDYKITIAIDDSKSMHHNNSKTLTLEAISLVSQALTLLESGRLSILSFGESPQIVLNHTEQLDGPKLVNALTFAQDKTNIAELLDFVRTVNTEEGAMGSSDNGLFENLLLILSDGRNIFSEGKTKVKNAIKLARLQRIFLVYIIIDNPENKNSILDIQTMEILPDKRINIKSYLDDFPFPYYVIVRDLNQLPLVLSEAMRQWFELVNSEQ